MSCRRVTRRAWRHPPFEAEIDDGILYGRGAADMKGGIAAALAAALQFLSEKGASFGGSISFLITADEEGPAINGTRKVVDWLAAKGEKPDACIIGEPTSEEAAGDTIKIGRRGSLSCHLKVAGVQGHAAYPEKARNPLPALIDALSLLKSRPLDTGSEHFQPSNLEITSIDTGNPASNVIPAGASARFNIRFNSRHTSGSLKAWIEGQAGAALAGRGIDYTLEYDPPAESFLTEPGGFVQMLSNAALGRDRPDGDAVDRRRHLGRALYQGSVPRGRAWPLERDRAQGGRMRSRGRSRKACGHLPAVPAAHIHLITDGLGLKRTRDFGLNLNNAFMCRSAAA